LARPACGLSRRRNDHGYEQEEWIFTTQQEPKSASEIGIKVRFPIHPEEGSWRFQAGAAQGNGRLPVSHEVPGCSCEIPFLRRIAYGGTINLGHVAVPLHNTNPLRIAFAVTGQHAEPDDMALEP
jgi:hypothetical protein